MKRVDVEFDFGKTVGAREHYVIHIEASDDVNLQDAICYLGNMLYLGKRPPEHEIDMVIDEPVPWRRLKDKYYAGSWKEFEELQEKYGRSREAKDERVHQKRLRLEE